MFSLLNLILTVFILVRVYRFDKFYLLTYDMRIREYDKKQYRNDRSKNK